MKQTPINEDFKTNFIIREDDEGKERIFLAGILKECVGESDRYYPIIMKETIAFLKNKNVKSLENQPANKTESENLNLPEFWDNKWDVPEEKIYVSRQNKMYVNNIERGLEVNCFLARVEVIIKANQN